MSQFIGFPSGKLKLTPIPDLFFSELLPSISDMGELQIMLYMFWCLHRQTGYPRYMAMSELEGEGLLLSALQKGTEQEQDTRELLHRAVELGVQHQLLLMLEIGENDEKETYLFMNTAQGRQAVQEISRGELVLENTGRVRQAQIKRERPNIFQLYEDNIGLLTPLLAEELEEAARDYPTQWIEDAFRIAVESNVHNWRYIRAILERWATEGRGESPQCKTR